MSVQASPERTPWTILALVCVAQFMVILDVTVVNVALPSIGADLGFAAADLQWVVTAYVLLSGGLLLLGGRLSDLVGRRSAFLGGLGLFTVASLASGLAVSDEMLIASRALQGIGAALLTPAALSIITATYSGEQRTVALSTWGALGAGGAAAGVLVGGVLTSWLSWEWVFLVNVPIGVVAGVVAIPLLPRSVSGERSLARLDVPGALTVVAGLGTLVYAVEGAARRGWGSPGTLVPLAMAGLLLVAFALIERRSPHALVPTATWRTRSLVSSAAIMLGATGVLVGVFFINSLFLQQVLGFSALETGLAFLPLVLVIGVAAHLGPRLLARGGARAVVVGGMAMIAAGELLLTAAPADAAYFPDLLPGYLLLGFGVGLAFVAASVTAMAEVDHERAGLASGFMTTAHELGGAFGVALFSTIALGSGALVSSGSALADGYGDGSLAGAAVAATLAVVALAGVPAFRPTHAQVAVH